MFLAAGSAASAAAASGGERLPFFRNADYHVRELPSPREALLGYSVYHEFDVDPRKTAESAANFAAPTWNLEVRGKVGKTLRLNAGDLVSMFPLEERVYRFRTITGVGMVVPWLGFPLELLLDRAAVSADAKFATFTSHQDPEQLPNQRPDSGLGLDWPYRESLTLAEASHPLAFLAVGVYGYRLPAHFGAPVRLIVPWKYSYKGPNAVVSIELSSERPASTWETALPHEYEFSGNVDPARPHPRWGQGTERRLDRAGRWRSLPYNGYGKDVQDLYPG